MRRNLIEIGGNRALILSREMLEHLGVTDAVEVTLEDGRLVLSASSQASSGAPAPAQTFAEAAEDTLAQYDEALRRLSL